MRGSQSLIPLEDCSASEHPPVMTSDVIRAVEVAATANSISGFEPNHCAPALQAAVAAAVTHGMPIKDVAEAAHMTALEVLDAADSLTYSGAAVPPRRRPPR